MTSKHVDTLFMRCMTADAVSIAQSILAKSTASRYRHNGKITVDLCHSLFRCLVHLRDRGDITLTPQVAKSYLSLDALERLTRHDHIPEELRNGLLRYLKHLPEYAGHAVLSPLTTRQWHLSYTHALVDVLENEA